MLTGVNKLGIKFWVVIVRGEINFGSWPVIRVKTRLAFSPLITTLFPHGFKVVKPSKMVRFEVFKNPEDSFYIAPCPVRGEICLRLQFRARVRQVWCFLS